MIMSPDHYTTWEPEPGWIFLLPSRLPDRIGNLILPESYTKKNNSGICVKAEKLSEKALLGRECLFPTHSEYQVLDSDTGFLIYIVEVNKVIMTRKPPADIERVSREKTSGLAFETITHDQRDH